VFTAMNDLGVDKRGMRREGEAAFREACRNTSSSPVMDRAATARKRLGVPR
jgi:hypothetical protein